MLQQQGIAGTGTDVFDVPCISACFFAFDQEGVVIAAIK